MQANKEISAVERAHHALRSSILSGELAPGAMISEAAVAESLSMSRTPVRSALARLQDEGWITIYPRRGALVCELTVEQVRGAAEVRRALESTGVSEGTPQARKELEQRGIENLHRQQEALEAGDHDAFATLTMEFHRSFVELASNPIMLSVYDRLLDFLRLSLARSAQKWMGEPVQIIAEHKEMLKAAVEGNTAEFLDLLKSHQTRIYELR
jgi:DNA-binding GntR family transcriptional regulator